MGLRGCVDAWGVPVIREGFTRPALTEPVNKPTVNTRPVNKPAVNKPVKARSAPEPASPFVEEPQMQHGVSPATKPDRAAYLREYMRARRARAKQTKI